MGKISILIKVVIFRNCFHLFEKSYLNTYITRKSVLRLLKRQKLNINLKFKHLKVCKRNNDLFVSK